MADHVKPLLPDQVLCLTPACKTKAEPEGSFRHGALGIAVYVCPRCKSVTLWLEAPMIIAGQLKRSQDSVCSITLCQDKPEAIKAILR